MFHLFKPSQKKLIEQEIEESQRLLLQAHTNKEHWTAQVAYHDAKLKRLTGMWNKITSDEGKEKNGSDKGQ